MTDKQIGYDYAWTHPDPHALKNAGATFVCRYLSTDMSKNISANEVAALGAVGLSVVFNWETTADRAEGGYSAGVSDAQTALAQAAAVGMPQDRPIFFSVDEDTEVGPLVSGYFQGVNRVLGVDRTGGYGDYKVIKALFDLGLIRWGWQTYAWSAGFWDMRAQLRQVQNGVVVGGIEVDRNEAQTADFGQWPHEGDDELQPADWDRLTQIVRQAVSDGVKAELALLQGTRTTPKGNPATGPVTMANVLDAVFISYHGIDGDPTHPGLTDVVKAAADTNSRISNLQVGTVDPLSVRAALAGLKIQGAISE